MKREMTVAGAFYPAECSDLGHFITEWNNILDAAGVSLGDGTRKPRVAVVPHAGYVYSGFTANVAYKALETTPIDTVVILGPSHRVRFAGISVGDFEAYKTPCGDLRGDDETVAYLRATGFGQFVPQVHQEHSTEVQFPFVRHYFPEAAIVECVYGNCSPEETTALIDAALALPRTAVIVSTDLSHYYDLKRAEALDHICLEAVAELSEERLAQGCEACGMRGLQGALRAARTKGLRPRLLDYRTSADASMDTGRVVGYMSAVLV